MALSPYTTRTLCKRLLYQARPYWPRIGGLFLLDLLATPLALLGPLPLKIAVDSVIGSVPLPGFLELLAPDWISHSSWALLCLAAGLQVVAVLLIQLRELSSYVMRTAIGEKLTRAFQAQLFRHVQRLSLLFHDARGTADSIYRIQYDAPSIQWVPIYTILPCISATIMLLGMLYVTACINWQLALVALAITPCLFLYTRMYNLRMRDRYRDSKLLESAALKIIHEVLTAVRVVKAFGREDSEQERFIHHSGKSVRVRVRLSLAEGVLGLLVNLTTAVGTAIVLLIGIRSVQTGKLSLGELLMVMTYLTQLYGPLQTISGKVAGLQSGLASAQRAFELLDAAPEVTERPNAQALRRAVGAIEFRHVSFAYDNDHPILHDVSCQIPAGTRLGIMGRTGAGKTTLVSLLMRFYDPSEGAILLDGVDLRDYKLAELRDQFAIVLQEPVLFSTSIADNIAYARPGASAHDIIAAAKTANAHTFITSLPDGYHTLVGERGMRLSGGERQRISLARAFLKDAPLLLLDEPTSSIDVRTEDEIMHSMEKLMQGRTTFMIAHRLSTLATCDMLLHIESGRLTDVTTGTSVGGQ